MSWPRFTHTWPEVKLEKEGYQLSVVNKKKNIVVSWKNYVFISRRNDIVVSGEPCLTMKTIGANPNQYYQNGFKRRLANSSWDSICCQQVHQSPTRDSGATMDIALVLNIQGEASISRCMSPLHYSYIPPIEPTMHQVFLASLAFFRRLTWRPADFHVRNQGPRMYTCSYIYIHTYIHTYITLHYITLHYITLHYITLHYITYIHTYGILYLQFSGLEKKHIYFKKNISIFYLPIIHFRWNLATTPTYKQHIYTCHNSVTLASKSSPHGPAHKWVESTWSQHISAISLHPRSRQCFLIQEGQPLRRQSKRTHDTYQGCDETPGEC